MQLTHFPDNALERPFSLIEIKVQHLRDYVGKWLQFQSLWDLEAEYIFNRLLRCPQVITLFKEVMNLLGLFTTRAR